MHQLLKNLLPIVVLSLTAPLSAQERQRADIPARYRWDLTDLYPSDAAWKKAKQQFIDELHVVEGFRGTLGTSADQLFDCLVLRDRLNKDFARMFTYVNLSLDQDLRNQSYLALQQELNQVGTTFEENTAFIEPEILKIAPDTIQSYLERQKGLGIYRHYLGELFRGKAHVGTAGEEKIMALAGLLADAPSNINDVFTNADFPFATITLSNGDSVRLDQSAYQRLRASLNGDDRRKASLVFLIRFNDYRRTFGTLMNAQVQKDFFYAKARNYNSCLESSLDIDNIPTAVYTSLVDNVNRNLGTFHRYLKLRKRILGVAQLHDYDLSAPLLAGINLKYTVKEAEKNILVAFKPLGGDYIAMVKKAFDQRWIDLYPSDGKRPGGYANSWAYDAHPYVLVNYDGTYNKMTGLAHELGHAMQGYLSNRYQPFATAACPRFVVEVASTFNEALLIDYMLRQVKDDDTRLAMLGNYLDGAKTTVFRAAQVSEFELRIHQMAERGDQLTGDALNDVYLEIAKKYYGHDQQICVVDDEAKAGWMFIPQLYSSFYAYQYAVSYTASAALSEKVLSGDQTTVKRYIGFLSAGGSDYSLDLLRKAGVDMTTPEPFDLAMRKMNRAMDEMERILERKGK